MVWESPYFTSLRLSWLLTLLGNFCNDDASGNVKIKKNKIKHNKTTILLLRQQTFLFISLPSLHDHDVESIATFYGSYGIRRDTTTNFYFCFWNRVRSSLKNRFFCVSPQIHTCFNPCSSTNSTCNRFDLRKNTGCTLTAVPKNSTLGNLTHVCSS